MRQVIYRSEGVKKTTIPVRIDKGLYAQVAQLAAREGRTVRSQLERLAAEAIAAMPVLEVRKGGRR